MRRKPTPYRFDSNGRKYDSSSLSVIAWGSIGGKDVFILRGEKEDYYAQHQDLLSTRVEPITKKQAQIHYIEFPERYESFDKSFDVEIAAADYHPRGM